MMKMMGGQIGESKKILEINPTHPLIKNLAQLHRSKSDEAILEGCALQLYEGALLIDGNMETPTDFVARMTDIMEQATR